MGNKLADSRWVFTKSSRTAKVDKAIAFFMPTAVPGPQKSNSIIPWDVLACENCSLLDRDLKSNRND